MIKANFRAYDTYVTDSLYQWDINQVLSVFGLNLAVAPEVHFSNANMDKAIVRQSTLNNHIVSVQIPNSLLQDPLTIKAHIGIYEGSTFKVVELVEIPVIPKKRPADYTIENTDQEIYSFEALKNALANKADDAVINARVDNIIAHNNDTEGNTELLDIRTDINGKVHASAGTSVRSQINTLSGRSYYIGKPKDKIKIRKIVTGSYYSSSNGLIINSDDYKRSEDLIPCGENVLLTCQQKSNDDTMMIVCYDKEFNFIDYRMILTPVKPSSHTRFAMTPKDTAYIGFNVMVTNLNSEYTLDIIDGSDVINISYPFEDNNKKYLAFRGYWIDATGKLTQASNLTCIFIPNITGDKIYVDQDFLVNAVFFDENNTIISNGETYIQGTPKGRIYDIPSNAKMVVINLSNTQMNKDNNPSSYATIIRSEDNRLSGKKILAIGDSITWLDGRIGNYDGGTSMVGWQSKLRKLGALVDTLGYSGACYANNSEGTSIYQNIVTDNVDVSGYDIVILFGGANDVRLSISIGDASNAYASPNLDPDTFNGAIGALIEYIRTNNPTAEVYICTTLPSESENRLYEKNKQYRDAIIHNAEFWAVSCIDLFVKINVFPGINFDTYFYDNTHPNTKGMERIGDIIAKHCLNY